MKNLKFHFDKIDFTLEAIENLNNEYQGQTKGDAYNKRFQYLHKKIEHHVNKIRNYGKGFITRWEVKTLDSKDIIHSYLIYLPEELTKAEVSRLMLVKTGHNSIHDIVINDIIETGSLIRAQSS